jgi:hypothetical protein
MSPTFIFDGYVLKRGAYIEVSYETECHYYKCHSTAIEAIENH